MEKQETKLTRSEIDHMLKEAEAVHSPRRTVNYNRKKRKRIRADRIIVFFLGVAVLVGLFFLAFHRSGKQRKKSDIAKEETKVQIGSELQDDQYPEITELVQNYLNAYLLDDNEERMNKIRECVVDLDDISDIGKRGYVKNYSEVECYTKDGPYDATYIVYAYYQTTYVNIATPAPSISVFYVMRKGDTMDVYIKNKIPDDVDQYIKKVSKDSDVQSLLGDVQKEIEDARTKDQDLNTYLKTIAEKSTQITE